MAQVRWSGEDIWRPSIGSRAAALLMGLFFMGVTTSLFFDGEPLSTSDIVLFAAGDVAAALLLPIVLFRWRLVLEQDELLFVFVRVRRLALREIVDVKCVAKQGLVFVCSDGAQVSFAGLGNSAWGHRKKHPTRSDLAARAVLVAAAASRGEVPPLHFRLARASGFKQAAIENGIWAAVVGLLLGS